MAGDRASLDPRVGPPGYISQTPTPIGASHFTASVACSRDGSGLASSAFLPGRPGLAGGALASTTVRVASDAPIRQRRGAVTMRVLSKDLVKIMNRDARVQLLEFAKVCGTPPPIFSYEVRGTKKKVYNFCTVTLPLSLAVMRRLGLRELKGAGLARVKTDATVYGGMSVIEMLEFGLGAPITDLNREYRRIAEAEAAKLGVKLGVQGGIDQPQDMAAGMGVDLKTLKRVGGEDAVNAARMVYLTATAPPKVEYYEQLAKDGVHPQVNVTFYVVPKIPSKKNPDCRPEKLVAVAHGGAEDHKNEVEVITFLKAAQMLVGPLGKRRCREVLQKVRDYPNLGLAAVFPQLSQMQRNGLGNALTNHMRAIRALKLEEDGKPKTYKRRILRKLELVDRDESFDDPDWARRLRRRPLPIDDMRRDLAEALSVSDAVVVEGGTGSGKTTRVPQFILDDALEKGNAAHCSILVAEPRRIAAVSAATRVAYERGDSLGDRSSSVGYHIRLERRAPRPQANIEFVTTGVLLRRLQANPTLEGISHVVVDEVHERDSNTDFLLIALKEALAANPKGTLKVIVMSATLDSGALRDYLEASSSVSVPSGPLFPVQEYHLEDIAKNRDIGSRDIWMASKQLIDMEKKMDPAKDQEELKVTFEDIVVKGDGKAGDQLRQMALERLSTDTIPQSGRMMSNNVTPAGRLATSGSGTDPYGTGGIDPSQREEEDVTYETLQVELMADCVTQLVRQRKIAKAGNGGGCVLCFLPGWEEIQAVRGYLEQSIPSRLVRILPLHSSIPNQQQKFVFEPVPPNIVKIVLATNIAETSITIPDVTVVVDSGRAREMHYHATSKYSSLDLVHISLASTTQRRGRAGRVQRGQCYRLFSKDMESRMLAQSTPEMKRCSLESLCLQARAITSLPVQQFLAKALDPPAPQRVDEAMRELIMLGAVRLVRLDVPNAETGATFAEELTPLGEHLAALPVEPLLGRMILLSMILGGFETGLTIAAVLSVPDIFLASARQESKKRLQQFCATSDVLAMVAAYNTWATILRDRGAESARSFAYDNELSIPSLTMIDGIRKQLRAVLKARGFFNREVGPDKLIMDLNEHGGRLGLQLALVCSAIPNMGHRTTGSNNIITRSVPDGQVHPASVNSVTPGSRAAWYLYQEMVLTTRPYLRNTTVASALEIVLYGGSFISDDTLGGCILDRWILTKGDPDNVNLLIQTRRAINEAMEETCRDPSRVSSPTEKRLIATSFEIIEQVRGTQMPVTLEQHLR